jgi:hypothetical protein
MSGVHTMREIVIDTETTARPVGWLSRGRHWGDRTGQGFGGARSNEIRRKQCGQHKGPATMLMFSKDAHRR